MLPFCAGCLVIGGMLYYKFAPVKKKSPYYLTDEQRIEMKARCQKLYPKFHYYLDHP